MKTENQLQLVTFEQAKRLKAAGFDWYCNKKYAQWMYLYSIYSTGATGQIAKPGGDEYLAPTVALALKWFRDEKKIKSNVLSFDRDNTSKKHFDYSYRIVTHHTPIDDNSCYKYSATNYDTYESAESALLDELLNLLEPNTA